jgi:cell surface protein SprA
VNTERKHLLNYLVGIGILILTFSQNTFANGLQTYIDTPEVELPFPIEEHVDPTGAEPQSFDLGNPANVTTTIEYDPVTGTYIFTETIGENIQYRPPSMMTLEEYLNYMQQKEMEQYWKERIAQQNQQNQQGSLIPPIKIDSDAFRNIFGSDEISIRPQGSVELSFGVNHSRYDNPILPENQRKITRFDFNQNIQLNLVGQIGTRVKLATNYNTRAAFDFENISNLRHSGDEDDLLQLLELGNITFPLNTTLIPGSQTLFGAKTRLQFGKLTVDAIASQSRGQKQVINVQGGAQTTQFNIGADAYEQNKHYFLGHYFHDNYDQWMSTLPIVGSPINITRIEVWVTNRQNITENTRNIIAFADLGESIQENFEGGVISSDPANARPKNDANNLYDWAVNNPEVRSFFNATSALATQAASPGPFNQAFEYEKVENARKLTEQEFSYNALLGYISLNMPLNTDEVLGVAYEYTVNGRTFQVGEFSQDGVAGTDALYLKMLRSTILSPQMQIWDLMMKNVYSVGGFQLNQDNFRMDIWYNNPETSLPVNFMPYPVVEEVLLVELLEMDKLNITNQPFSDGIFDFAPIQMQGNRMISGGTINPQNGRVYLSTVNPFGQTLREKLVTVGGMSDNQADRIAFTELYDSTQIQAQLLPRKNRFSLRGEFKSSVTGDIPLNALNVPQGGVTVIAGGVPLTEGIDYQVDYSMGRVRILNTAILESNVPIQIQVESNSIFGFQQKTYLGTHFNYRFNKDFNIGATWVNAKEKPLTPKINIGDEPYSNHIVGLNIDFRKEMPWITRMVDALPVISTSAPSFVTFKGEGAYLIPGTPRGLQGQGGTSYIDDFEASQSIIDLRTQTAWKVASIPQGQPDLFPEANLVNDLALGYNRALLSWYSIDPLFYQNNNLTPAHIQNDPAMLQDSRMRIVLMTELFPNLNLQQFTFNNVPSLDLAFYPQERGMYNYDINEAFIDADGRFTNPRQRWGGIMRAMSTTNFEQANIEFIQFWLLDPFNEDAVNANGASNGGVLYINLGNISEDVLRDSRKSFEHGLPVDPNDLTGVDITAWGRVPKIQTVVNAFDNDDVARGNQDVGMDGVSNVNESTHFAEFVTWVNSSSLSDEAKARLLNDPSTDDFTYYRDDNYDLLQYNILERYKKFNGLDGNSPTIQQSASINAQGYPTQATNAPDIEDNNTDNNLSESESYFQYKIELRPETMVVGQNNITSVTVINKPGGGEERWYQFRIPVFQPNKAVNGITDFRSIRFMRMYLQDWDQEVVLRFARLELVRGEWRRYMLDLYEPGDGVQVDPNLTTFNIGVVNIEEHDQRVPIRYVLPPGIQREIDPAQIQVRQLNEQSMVLSVCDLQDGDARAGFRNVAFNLNNYQKMKMFVHAEEVSPDKPLADDDLTVFVRLGTDMEDNYYEYEIPLKLTPWGASSELEIWPDANNIEIVFEHLTNLKKRRNDLMAGANPSVNLQTVYSEPDPNDPTKMIRVKGSPNLQGLRVIMIGVRNPKATAENPWKPDDALAKCVEVWVNELRLTDFLSEGGGAAVANLQVQMADFANVNMNASYYGQNWGSVESRVQQRQRDTRLGFDVNSTMQLGKFFGTKARISMPFFWAYSIASIRPEFDPFNPDIKLSEYTGVDRRERQRLGTNSLMRRGYNFNNVRRERGGGKTPHFYDIENWSANYGFTEDLHRDFNLEYDRTRIWKGGLNYNFNATPKYWEPLKDVAFFGKSKWWNIIKEAGIYLGPKSLTFTNNLLRTYNERLVRNNVSDFTLRPVYIKNFTWDRHYQVRYDVTKNLKFDFMANNRSLFVEPNGQIDRRENPEVYQEFRDTIFRQLGTGATPMNYSHNYNLSWTLPFNRIPATDWITATARYSGGYEWNRGPLAQPDFGNTIQNNRNVNIQAQLNFVNLYNKNWYFKKVNGGGGGASSNRQQATGDGRPNATGGNAPKNAKPEGILKWRTERNKKKKTKLQSKLSALEQYREPSQQLRDSLGAEKIQAFQDDIKALEERIANRNIKLDTLQQKAIRQAERRKKPVHPVAGFGARAVMTVRNVSGTYVVNDGTMLPGYNQDPRYLGMNNQFAAPTTGFVFGAQERNIWGIQNGLDITDRAVQGNWLVQNNAINTQFVVMHSQNITGRALLEPIKDLRIELTLTRNFTQNSNSFFRWNDEILQFENQSQFMTQNIMFSTITLGSAFVNLTSRDQYASATFDQLLQNLQPVSGLFGNNNPNSTLTSTGYYDGYDRGQQDVVMGAFIAAYSGRGVTGNTINPLRSVPLPNWTLTYDGLTKFKFTKKFLRNFVIKHGYSSSFSISGMQTNLNYETDINGFASGRDLNGNFISPMLVQNLSIIERFTPLLGVDATWVLANNALITKIEYKRDRSIGLGLANNQVTEIIGKEWIIGLGYKIDKLVIKKIKINGKPIESPLNFRFDLSIRDNITVIRKIIEESNQATAGQKVFSIRSTLDYNLTRNLTLQMYYDQMITTPVIATSYPTGNMSCGFRLRINLGGL